MVLAINFSKSKVEKYVFLKILQISQENTCFGVFFNKVAGSQVRKWQDSAKRENDATVKQENQCNSEIIVRSKRLQHMCFPVKCSKIFRTIHRRTSLPDLLFNKVTV